jgi:hypothetical protein
MIGLSSGTLFGIWKTRAAFSMQFAVSRTTAPTVLDDFSLMQYRHADTEHAESALLNAVGLLEGLEKLEPTKLQKLILANTYVRLAVLEESKDPKGSIEHMAKARYWYTASGGALHSDAEMKAALKLADDRIYQHGLR